MHIVFLDTATFSASVDLSPLQQSGWQLTCYQTTEPEQIAQRLQDADIAISNKVKLNSTVLPEIGKVKLICVAATGTNNIDLAWAKQNSIAVCNVAGYAKYAVSQYIFAQLLAYTNQVKHYQAPSHKQAWPNSKTFCLLEQPIIELAGKTLGLIGYGDIAQQVEQIAQTMGMHVLISERHTQTTCRPGRLPFKRVVTQADIISIHCPLTDETELLFDAETLALMKPSAILINTARGGIVCHRSLLHALESGQLAHAIIDVLETEPPAKDHVLIKSTLPNLVVTGHIAWASQAAQQKLIVEISENITAFLNGEQRNRVL